MTIGQKKVKRVAVIMGGWSGEREVSLSSAQGVIKALAERGYEVIPIDLTRDLREFLQKLLQARADVVFMNAMHGRWGEDGCLQGLLEMLGLPYTNSGVLASALAMDKPFARKIFKDEGIPCPEGFVAERSRVMAGGIMPCPYVIKPLQEGSSLGVHIITDEAQLRDIEDTWEYGDQVLVERYIPGREIQVAVLGDRVWGAIEICPHAGFYDYTAKYTDGKAKHLMPAPIHPQAYQMALDLAKRAHDALGCEGVTRVDMRYDDTKGEPGTFYVLEVNTQPGLTPLSLVPEIVAYHGMSYGDLVEWMIKNPRHLVSQAVMTSHPFERTAPYGESKEWVVENLSRFS